MVPKTCLLYFFCELRKPGFFTLNLTSKMQFVRRIISRTKNWNVWLSIVALSLIGILFHRLPANIDAILMMQLIAPLGDDLNSIRINPQSPNYSSIIDKFSYQDSGFSNHLSCFHQGQLVFWQEDYSKAISILNNCSGGAESQLKDMLLGEAYWLLGRSEEAVQIWQRVPKIISYFWQHAGIAEKYRQYELVEELFDKMMQINPDWQPAKAGYWFGKSMLYLKSADSGRDDYVKVVEKALEFNADSGSRQLQLGAELYRKREYALAEQSLINTIKLEPRSRWAYYYLGLVYFRTEKYLEAIAEFDATLAIDPDFGNAHFYAAQSYLKLGQIENALHRIQEAIRISPDNAGYLAKMKEVEKLAQEISQ